METNQKTNWIVNQLNSVFDNYGRNWTHYIGDSKKEYLHHKKNKIENVDVKMWKEEKYKNEAVLYFKPW